jgi:hypothetical protein
MERKKLALKQARAKFIVTDGSDDPYISTQSELNGDINSVLKLCADCAEDALIQDDPDEYPSEWRRALNGVIDGKQRINDDDWWIRVYLIDDKIVDEWNDYCDEIDYPEDKVILERDRTIKNALWSRKHVGLIEFIDSRYGAEKSYYIPEEIVDYKRIQRRI